MIFWIELQVQRERERLGSSNLAESQQGKTKKDIIEDLKESMAILSDENQALKGKSRSTANNIYIHSYDANDIWI